MTYAVEIRPHDAWTQWRTVARRLASHQIAPENIDWSGGGLFAGAPLPEADGARAVTTPPAFVKLAQSVIWHSAPERFALLYQALWRLMQKDAAALSQADELGRRLGLLDKAVRRDIHKMHAFVRFREMPSDGARRRFAAWFEPDHHTLEPGAIFFTRRFADMDWAIATPSLTARFEDGNLAFAPGAPRPDLPQDASEALWATYYANIFNPARIKLDAMRSEMPRKYWKNLPETRLIPAMLADAEARVARMREAGATTPHPSASRISTRYRASMPQPVETPATMAETREAAMACRRCGLCEKATQTVWGEGADDAALMIVGEQPGDREDLEGRPFIGPAGALLRQTSEQAGVDLGATWLTNAVKHFKFAPRGKQRLHQSPNVGEIDKCRWWLKLELDLVRPRLVVALGATAARALTGDDSALTHRRGQIESGLHGGPVLIAWHPARILRLPDPLARQTAGRELQDDLKSAAALIDSRG